MLENGKTYSREDGLVPTGSTYLEVDVVNTNNNICSACRIYPGVVGIERTFDIKAGHEYTLKVTINDGIVTGEIGNKESTANTEARVLLPPDNNCYMIHPKVQILDGVPAVYELPIYSRINEYWGTNWGYDGVGNVSANVIGDNTEWEAEVIWQDIKGDQLLYFCDIDRRNTRDTYSGKGLNSLYFTLNENFINEWLPKKGTGDDQSDIYGSILVGVKKKGETKYLWSWHLWVTDYYPYEMPAYSGGTLEYGAENVTDFQGYYHRNEQEADYRLKPWGNVHHYGHDDSYDNDYMGNSWLWSSHSSDNVWDGNGIYSKKWIMDRNLGSQSATNLGGKYPFEAFGTYYQYGRKDPIPVQATTINTGKYSELASDFILRDPVKFYGDYALYNIKGQKLANSKFTIKTGPVTMNEGVQNPTTIYTYNSSISSSWTTFNGGTNWYTPQKKMGTGKKTIFDPCPPGYCIPTFDAFDFLNSNIWVHSTEAEYSPPLIALRPISSNVGGNDNIPYRTMCVFQTKNSSGTLEVALPCQGNINPNNGLLEVPANFAGDGADARGYYWVLDRKADDTSYGIVKIGETQMQRLAPEIYQGQGLGIGNGHRGVGGTLGNDHWPRPNSKGAQDDRTSKNGYACWVYSYAGYRENFSASRGHNIRCVQEPD